MISIPVSALAVIPAAPVLDVREPDEYAAGHAPGAVNIPLRQLRSRMADVPEHDPLYVICQSGRRSAQAVEALEAAGVVAVNVEGGTAAWVEAGLPLQTGGQSSIPHPSRGASE